MTRASLWAGRATALVGILLLALNLRAGVTSLAPVAGGIAHDIPLGTAGLSVLGMVPPLAFALGGVLGAAGARRFGLLRFTIIAVAAMAAGLALRAGAWDYASLLLGSVVGLAGAGFGNVILPPLVKRYFPDRIGLVTSAYAIIVGFSTGLPAVVAMPLSDVGGWRFSLAVWPVLAVMSLIPWMLLLARERRDHRRARDAGDDPAPLATPLSGAIWKSRTAWVIAGVFGLISLHAYANMAWLPMMLTDLAGLDEHDAGLMLGVYGLMGVPAAVIGPLIAVRLRNAGNVVHVGVACYLVGYGGLLALPHEATLLWSAVLGFAQVTFPASLVLINLRTRTEDGSVALSGFAQGFGYAVAALGPLLVGAVFELSGGWIVPIVSLLGLALLLVPFAIALRRRAFVEDDLTLDVRA